MYRNGPGVHEPRSENKDAQKRSEGLSSNLSKLMSDISSAFQLSLNGKEAELASMLQSRMIDAAACQTTGFFAGWSLSLIHISEPTRPY